jgi:acyl-CoA synthetase (NDP forming)
MVSGVYTGEIKKKFEEKGLPVFPTPERCVKAMSVLVERGRMNGC